MGRGAALVLIRVEGLGMVSIALKAVQTAPLRGYKASLEAGRPRIAGQFTEGQLAKWASAGWGTALTAVGLGTGAGATCP